MLTRDYSHNCDHVMPGNNAARILSDARGHGGGVMGKGKIEIGTASILYPLI